LKQYTRIAFNSNNWKMPSGKDGKSNLKCFEADYHFGFEEWLFDESTLINGMKYAFLQGVAKSTKLRNFPKELILYTLNKHTKECLHIATLKKWEYFEDVNYTVQNEFDAKGWIKQMRKQVQAVKGDVKMFNTVVANKGKFKQYEPLFNVRFEFKDLHILPQPKVFPKGHKIYKLNRYRIYEF
jgi:hypothetical protein